MPNKIHKQSALTFIRANNWETTLHRGLATLNDGYHGVTGAAEYKDNFDTYHLEEVTIRYNPRMTSYFGRAHGASHIDLNPRLELDTPGMEWQRKETFFHELAHTMMPGQHHSALWAWCFNCFGFMPLRHGTADMDKMAAQSFVAEFLTKE